MTRSKSSSSMKGVSISRIMISPQKQHSPETEKNHLSVLLTTCFYFGDESSPPCRRVADTSRLRCGRPSPLCWSVRCLRGFPPLLWIYVVVSLIPLFLLSVRCSIFFFATFLTSVHGCGCPLALQFALLQFSNGNLKKKEDNWIFIKLGKNIFYNRIK